MLLFPDPRPLVERLGVAFFRQAPQCPGVYLMRDVAAAVLYVGKAKNLRRRLGSYRVANPDRMSRRHLRMLRAVARIDLEELPDELSALARESALIRSLKPKFNRAGTWPAPARFLVWRLEAEKLELRVAETPEPGWVVLGPLRSAAPFLRNALVRLLWCALNSTLGPTHFPAGWLGDRIDPRVRVGTGELGSEVLAALENLAFNRSEVFEQWLRTRISRDLTPFERAVIEADLESLSQFTKRGQPPPPDPVQLPQSSHGRVHV